MIRSEHAAQLGSLRASHATTLAALKSDHSNQLSVLELSLQAANAQVEGDQVKLEGVVEERDVLVEKVKRLENELESAGGKSNEAETEVEAELKKVKAELQHVSDELAGALEVSTIPPTTLCTRQLKVSFEKMSEMNKTHFEQTLLAVHERQADEIRAAVESREQQYAEKSAQGPDKLRVPSTPPRGEMPSSPSMARLHEAHNAKVTELER